MMAGAGLDPRAVPPFMGADVAGLDDDARGAGARRAQRRALRAADDPAPARRAGPARAQERARASTPTRSPTPASRQAAVVKLETRGEVAIAWLDEPPDELDLAAGHRRISARSGTAALDGRRRARSSSPRRTRCCSAPARTSRRSRRWTRPADATLLDGAHALLREFGRSGVVTIAAVNGLALRRRLRAGDGLRRAPRGELGDLRPARDQARHHPRLRRHPAPAAAGRARTRRSR